MAVIANYPIEMYTNVDGSPLSDGYLYFGVSGLEPTGNPVSIYWDALATIPASQPIRTIDGYPSRNGTRANVYVDGDYSLQVQDKKQYVLLTVLSALENNPMLGQGKTISTIADLRLYTPIANTGSSATQLVNLLGHTSVGDGGGGGFYWDAASTDSDNNGSIVKVATITTGRWLRLNSDVLSIKYFGAIAGQDNTAAIQATFDACSGTGTTVMMDVPSGISSKITISKNNVVVQGDQSIFAYTHPFTITPTDQIQLVMFAIEANYVTFKDLQIDGTAISVNALNAIYDTARLGGGNATFEFRPGTNFGLVDNVTVYNDVAFGGASVLFRETSNQMIARNSHFSADTSEAHSGCTGVSIWGNYGLVDGCTALELQDELFSITIGDYGKIVNCNAKITRADAGNLKTTGALIAVANGASYFTVANNIITGTTQAGILCYNATLNTGNDYGVITGNNINAGAVPITANDQQAWGINLDSSFTNVLIADNSIEYQGNGNGVNAGGVSFFSDGITLKGNKIIKKTGTDTAGIVVNNAVGGESVTISDNLIRGSDNVGIFLGAVDYGTNDIHIIDNVFEDSPYGIGNPFGAASTNLTIYEAGSIFRSMATGDTVNILPFETGRGTWTPQFNSGGDVASLNVTSANWYRVGNLVFIDFSITLTNLNITVGGNCSITGLPFPVSGTSSGTIGYHFDMLNAVNFECRLSGSSFQLTAGGTAGDTPPTSNTGGGGDNFKNTTTLVGSAVYTTDS
ncbi:hypothetical protein N9917_02335 [Deltaproteobacteria bacterium]|nr:hypothetical protein [Deltaproteobacteria bacterium]